MKKLKKVLDTIQKTCYIALNNRKKRMKDLFDFLSFAFAGLCGILLFIVVLKTPSEKRLQLIEKRIDAIEQRVWNETYADTRATQEQYLEARK